MKRSKKYVRRYAEDTKMAMHKYGCSSEIEIIEVILDECSKELNPDTEYIAFLQERYKKVNLKKRDDKR
ncbi:MAG: hypothetical protein NZ529_11155 [Cytophagaceae bacterium]|nr:hypothetical protein [Cytophagaceae bacterium]MDW8457341.1 hypothetical protein [Cytophagaceae bacterium]